MSSAPLHIALYIALLILQPFRHFIYCMSQLILQPFRRFIYVTAHSPTLPLLHLRHSSFSNPSFASPTSQALHLIHLASRPWFVNKMLTTVALRPTFLILYHSSLKSSLVGGDRLSVLKLNYF